VGEAVTGDEFDVWLLMLRAEFDAAHCRLLAILDRAGV
jgi:hypothetical protein